MLGSCVKLTKTDWLWPTTQAEDMQYWSPLHFVYDPPSQLELPTRLEWVDSFELHLSDFPHETKPTIKTTDEAAATRPEVATASRAGAEGEIHRVDPDFGSSLTVSNRDSHSNCWVNWKIMGQPCGFQV